MEWLFTCLIDLKFFNQTDAEIINVKDYFNTYELVEKRRFCSMSAVGPMLKNRWKPTWKRWNGRSYRIRRTYQTLLLPTTICLDWWHTAWLISVSVLIFIFYIILYYILSFCFEIITFLITKKWTELICTPNTKLIFCS